MLAVGGPSAEAANPSPMTSETRFERRLDRWLARATTPRGAAIVIATVTTSITVVAGLLMTVIDHGNFPSVGSGLWWAIQTVTTVGYGDHVPTTAAGQGLAALVMLLGIGFITVITASITGAFVGRSRQQERPSGPNSVASSEHLRKIEARLERIEAAVSRRD
jgi:voltage-gated potassium channel